MFHALHQLWIARGYRDEYIGTLINAYLAQGGTAMGLKLGTAYVDVGTVHGYRAAIGLLHDTYEDHHWHDPGPSFGSHAAPMSRSSQAVTESKTQ